MISKKKNRKFEPWAYVYILHYSWAGGRGVGKDFLESLEREEKKTYFHAKPSRDIITPDSTVSGNHQLINNIILDTYGPTWGIIAPAF